MIYKLVNILLVFIVKRPTLIFLNALVLVFTVYCLKGMFGFIHFITEMSHEEIDNMNEILDGIAGVFVAIGVLMEERETIQKLAAQKPKIFDPFLNEVAHHNGMGLLLIGLFMELISLAIETPKSILNTNGVEVYLYVFGFIIIVFAALIQIDFIKDYIKTYYNKDSSISKH